MNKRLQKFLWIFLGMLSLLGSGRAWGQASITTGALTYTQNFDGLASTGSSTAVPAGVVFSEAGANANTTYVTGTGSSNAGDTYSFGSSGTSDRAFGGVRSSNLVPTVGLFFTNNTGSTITSLAISYTGEQWRFGAHGRADRLDFQYSITASSLSSGTYIDVDALDFTAPISSTTNASVGALNGNSASNRTMVTGTITGLSIPNGATFYIRYTDVDAAGADDGLAIDDFSLTAIVSNNSTPTLTATPNPLSLSYVAGGGPVSGTVNLSGSNLTPASEAITAASSSTAFTVSPISTSYTSSSLAATSFTVTMASGLKAGAYSATLTFSGGGATALVPITGTVTAANPPSLTVSPSGLSGFTANQGTASVAQTYTLTGVNLTAGVSVSAPTGFEISQDGSTFTNSLTVAQTGGVANATISARLSATASVGAKSGNITNASSGASTQNVAVSGTVSSTGSGNSTSNVVISQVYGGGGNSNTTYKNDFIELFNRGNTPVDITGWSVQYASSSGTFNQVTNLSGVIQPGGYYLIQEAAGTGGTTDLPNPDASGSIPMSGTNGKVALSNSTTPLGSTFTGSAIIDLVGYGSATTYEGTGATPALTNTTAALRNNNGCTDTDNNAADFVTGAPNPRNSASPTFLCNPTGPYLSVSPDPLVITYIENSGPASRTISVRGLNLSPESGNITITSSSTAIQLSYNGSAFANSVTIPYSSSMLSSTVVTAQLVSGLAPGSYPVSVSFVGGNATYTLPITGLVNSSALGGITPIATARTLPANTTVTIQGRVTVSSQFGGRLFYIQDNTGGVAVYSGASPAIPIGSTANIGDLVTVVGPVSIYNGYVEINGVSAYTITPGTPADAPAPIVTPLDQLSASQGKLVQVADVTIGGTGATFTGNTNYPINVGGSTGVLRINSSSELANASKPATATIIGIAERFVSGATTTGNDNIQLQPRMLTDVSGSSAVAATDQFCGSSPTAGTLTQDQTFDFATFNVEFFGAPAGTITCANSNLNYQNQGPSNELLQAQNVNKVLTAINADVFVLEEVSDQNLLANNLPSGYALMCSNRFSYYFQDECTQTPTNGYVFGPTSLAQKVCVAYKTSTVTSVSATPLLSDYYGYPTGTATSAPNNWSSGRLPYLFVADAMINGVTRRLHIIGIHAKSGSATSDYNRRKQDVLDLYNLLTNSSTQPGPLGSQFPNANILIAGDFNDYVTKSIASGQNSTYKPFVDDVTNFSVLTKPLEQNDCGTYFGNAGSSFLDHIVVSNELINAYLPGSIGIQTAFSGISGDFTGTTSDHRPVFARFDLSQIPAVISASLVASTTAVCEGTPVNFSVTVNGLDAGQTLSYTLTNGTNSTTGTGISTSAFSVSLIPTVPNAFTLTAQTTNNASTSAISSSVAINSVPTNVSLTSGTLTCAQTSVTLTASSTAGTSYTIAGPGLANPVAASTATVNAPGTYTVTASGTSGCLVSATATVASQTAAITNASLSGGTLTCSQTSVTLTASASSASSLSYTIAGPGLTNPVAASTISVSVAGTYSLTVTNANGCSAITMAEVVSNTVAPTSVSLSNGTLTCSQPSVLLTASSTGGVSYSLSDGQTNTNGQFMINAPGTYTLVVSSANTCTASTTATVSSNTAAPTNVSLTSGTLTCSQQSLTITASSTGGTSYLLSNGQSSANGQFVVATPGTYTVTAIGDNGCSATAIATVSADDSFTFATTPIQTNVNGSLSGGGSVTITAQLSGATDFTLTGPNGFSATSMSGSFTANQVGLYTVTTQNGTGCLNSANVGVQPATDPLVPGTFVPTNMLTCPQPGQTATAGFGAVATGNGFIFTGPDGYVFSNVYRQVGTYNIFASGITDPGTYTLTVLNQGLVVGVYYASITSDCTSGRVSLLGNKASLAGPELKVSLSGNPTSDEYVLVTVEGAVGQSLSFWVEDAIGSIIDQKQVVSAGAMEQQRLRFGTQKGSVYLKVRTPTTQKTIWIAR